jgi:hypothetical protein
VGETEPDDPNHVEVLEAASDETLTGDPLIDSVIKQLRTISRSLVTNDRLRTELAASVGFDVGTLLSLAEHLIEQQREIDDLRHGLEELRRRF